MDGINILGDKIYIFFFFSKKLLTIGLIKGMTVDHGDNSPNIKNPLAISVPLVLFGEKSRVHSKKKKKTIRKKKKKRNFIPK